MTQGIGDNGSTRILAHRCQLAEVRLGAHTFRSVSALYHPPAKAGGSGSGGLELSQHTSGILCGGLLNHRALTFDYSRMRVAVRGPA